MQAARHFALMGAAFGMIFAEPALYLATEKAVEWMSQKFYSDDDLLMIKAVWQVACWPLSFELLRATLYSAAGVLRAKIWLT